MSWKAILILVCVFITGTVSGVFLASPIVRKDVEQRVSSEQILPRQLNRFKQRLKLTPEQLEVVKPIIQKHSEELRKARSEAHRTTRDILVRMENSIAKELTPEQLEILKVMQAEEAERVQKLRENLAKPPQAPQPRDPQKKPSQKKDAGRKDSQKKDGDNKAPARKKAPKQDNQSLPEEAK